MCHIVRRTQRRPKSTRRPRKERVLHTRVSEDLEEELKKRAADLGVSVSNLVRNVLSNTIEMVEDIVQDATQMAETTRHSAEGIAAQVADAKRHAEGFASHVADATRHSAEDLAAQVADAKRHAEGFASSVADATRNSAEDFALQVAPLWSNAKSAVLGWQEMVLERNAVCDRCNTILKRGDKGAAGVFSGPSQPTFLCPSCLASVKPEENDADADQ